MVKQSVCEKEKSYVEKMNKFQLQHKYKKVGYIISFAAFSLMIVKKFVDEPSWVKPVLSGILLVGMLFIFLAKEKLEDEYLESLRSQSYRIAFILVILYALVQPFINFGVGLLFDETEKLEGLNYFQILFYMLVVQLMVFWQLKRMNR
jgi:hypothetical protein